MADYSEDAASALEAITEAGGFGVIVREPESTDSRIDPVTQQEISDAAAHTRVRGAMVELPSSPSASYKVGSLVNRSVRTFYIAYPFTDADTGAAVVFEPEPGDVIQWPGGPFKVLNTDTYRPDGGAPILTRALAEAT